MACTCKATVLVVDDDPAVRTITQQMLVSEGYGVLAASGAFEALGLLAEHEVDVLLTDLRMPGLSGFALAEQARRLAPSLRIIFTSGLVIKDDLSDQLQGSRLLPKPFRGRDLDAAIAGAMSLL